MANLLFDLDGTLIDSVPSMCAAANRVLARFDRAPIGPQTYKGFVGHGMTEQLRAALRHSGGIPEAGVDPVLADFLAEYSSDPVTGTLIYPDVVTVLEQLRSEGHRLAIITQKPVQPTRDILGALGMEALFDVVTGGDTLPCLKPDPRMITATLAGMQAEPAIMIGDSYVDAKTAAAAGIPFLHHQAGYGQLDGDACAGYFSRFEDLPDLIRQLALEPA